MSRTIRCSFATLRRHLGDFATQEDTLIRDVIYLIFNKFFLAKFPIRDAIFHEVPQGECKCLHAKSECGAIKFSGNHLARRIE